MLWHSSAAPKVSRGGYLYSQVDPEHVTDEEDDADGDEHDGQVHLPVAVARVDLGSSLADTPAKKVMIHHVSCIEIVVLR